MLSGMTDDEIEAERAAILAEERELEDAHEGLRVRPDDRQGHAAQRERLKAHTARVRAFKEALRQRSPAAAPRSASYCPVCQSESVMPRRRAHEYRCLTCRAVWIMGAS